MRNERLKECVCARGVCAHVCRCACVCTECVRTCVGVCVHTYMCVHAGVLFCCLHRLEGLEGDVHKSVTRRSPWKAGVRQRCRKRRTRAHKGLGSGRRQVLEEGRWSQSYQKL